MTGPDTIVLTLAPPKRLVSVATLVAGGVGGRLEFPVDRIDDLQLALSTLLGRADGSALVSIEFDADDRGVTCRLGPTGPWLDAVLPTVAKLVTHATVEHRDGDAFAVMRLDVRPVVTADGGG